MDYEKIIEEIEKEDKLCEQGNSLQRTSVKEFSAMGWYLLATTGEVSAPMGLSVRGGRIYAGTVQETQEDRNINYELLLEAKDIEA